MGHIIKVDGLTPATAARWLEELVEESLQGPRYLRANDRIMFGAICALLVEEKDVAVTHARAHPDQPAGPPDGPGGGA